MEAAFAAHRLPRAHEEKFRAVVHESQFVWERVRDEFAAYASDRGLRGGASARHPLVAAETCTPETCRLFWTHLYRLEMGDEDDGEDGEDDSLTDSDSDIGNRRDDGNGGGESEDDDWDEAPSMATVSGEVSQREAAERAQLKADVESRARAYAEELRVQARAEKAAREEAERQAEVQRREKLRAEDERKRKETALAEENAARTAREAEDARRAAAALRAEQARAKALEAERAADKAREAAVEDLATAIRSAEVEEDMSSAALLYKFNYQFEAHRLKMIDAQTEIFQELSTSLEHSHLHRSHSHEPHAGTAPATLHDQQQVKRTSTADATAGGQAGAADSDCQSVRQRKIHAKVVDRLQRDDLYNPSRAAHEETERRLEARLQRKKMYVCTTTALLLCSRFGSSKSHPRQIRCVSGVLTTCS